MKKSNYEKMISGEVFSGAHPDQFALRARQGPLKDAVDAIPAGEIDARSEALGRLFGSTDGFCMVNPPFMVDFGCHIHIGFGTFVNFNSTWLDSAPITLGRRCMVGPNVQFIAAGHPIRPEDRNLPGRADSDIPIDVACIGGPITIGDEVWIGAGAIILQDVVIGDGAVIGAGSVVKKSIPARTVAVGNPARVVRSVDD